METETIYRKEQSQKMADKIKEAHLTRDEALVLYSKIWIPQIQYALPITTFTETQAKQIHSPMLHATLPKLGFNRCTPRALVHGLKEM